MHITSREPSVDVVQRAFLELLIKYDVSFELKLGQKMPDLFTGTNGRIEEWIDHHSNLRL